MFLDDAQFSKGSYTNRVQIAAIDNPRWMTLPVAHAFGDPINRVEITRSDIGKAHLDLLFQTYRGARYHTEILSWIERLLIAGEDTNLARRNEAFAVAFARKLELSTRFERASSLGIQNASADERLARIVEHLAPNGVYLSGQGARAYQSEAPFASRGLTLRYSSFAPVPYERGGAPFLPGLSILDAIFHLGFEATRELLIP